MQYFKSNTVRKDAPRSRASGKRLVGVRCVGSNKDDAENPEIRCQLVCQETKTHEAEQFFAATPPVETLRMILSMAADEPTLQETLLVIS